MEGGDRGWNETGERDEREQGRGGEEDMKYPYIILTLFVFVWVDGG